MKTQRDKDSISFDFHQIAICIVIVSLSYSLSFCILVKNKVFTNTWSLSGIFNKRGRKQDKLQTHASLQKSKW